MPGGIQYAHESFHAATQNVHALCGRLRHKGAEPADCYEHCFGPDGMVAQLELHPHDSSTSLIFAADNYSLTPHESPIKEAE